MEKGHDLNVFIALFKTERDGESPRVVYGAPMRVKRGARQARRAARVKKKDRIVLLEVDLRLILRKRGVSAPATKDERSGAEKSRHECARVGWIVR